MVGQDGGPACVLAITSRSLASCLALIAPQTGTMVCPMRFVLLGLSAVLALIAVTWCNSSAAEGDVNGGQQLKESKVCDAEAACWPSPCHVHDGSAARIGA